MEGRLAGVALVSPPEDDQQTTADVQVANETGITLRAEATGGNFMGVDDVSVGAIVQD